MVVTNEVLAEGMVCEVEVCAKGSRGEGISRVGNMVVMIKNAKTRIGNKYTVKVTKVHRTFADADLTGINPQLIGNSTLEL